MHGSNHIIIVRIAAVLLLLTGGKASLYSQTYRNDTLSLKVYFRQGISKLDPDFRGNAVRTEALMKEIQADMADSSAIVRGIVIRGSASPEGNTRNNQILSEDRAAAIRNYLSDTYGLPVRLLRTEAVGEDWEGLARIVRGLDKPWRDEALDVIENTPLWIVRNGRVVDGRKNRLRKVAGGAAWDYLYYNYFPDLRAAGGDVSVIVSRPVREVVRDTIYIYETHTVRDTVVAAGPAMVPCPTDLQSSGSGAAGGWNLDGKRMLFALRTNALAIPLANVGVEVPLGRHWSIGADWYYPWIWRPAHRDGLDANGVCNELQALDLELRYWFPNPGRRSSQRLLGHSIGLYGASGDFDFERDWSGHQGEFWNVGVDYLFAAPIFGGRMHLEFELGVGYIHADSRPYDCFAPGDHIYHRKGVTQRTDWFGPTRAQVSLVVPVYVNKKEAHHEK